MAKPVKAKQEPIINKTTGEINADNIIALVNTNRVKTEKEAKLVLDIYDRFSKMKSFRDQSCPWRNLRQTSVLVTDDERTLGNETQYETLVSASGNGWEQRWRRDDELAMMKPSRNLFASGLPTVNVPVVWGAKQAITSQYQDQTMSITIEPQVGVDDIVAKVAELKIKDIEQKADIERMKKEIWFPSFVSRGTIITYNPYLCKKRMVKITQSLEEVLKTAGFDDEMLEEQQFDEMGNQIDPEMLKQIYGQKKQEFTAKIKKDPAKYLLKEVEIVDYDDPYAEMVNLEELYFDPFALDFNSLTRGCRDVCWVQYLPAGQVLEEYKNSNDIFIKKENLTEDLIISGNNVNSFYTGNDVAPIQNMVSCLSFTDQNDLACVVKYFNRETDKYVILINDIVVRDGVLPYNHKKLPFSKACMIEIPNCFYGMGYGVALDQTQQDIEFFTSLQSYLAERNSNAPIGVVGDELYSQLETLTAKGTEPLKAGSLVKMEQGETMESLQLAPTNFDIEKVLQRLQDNAVVIAGVNPQQNSLPNPNLAVRSAQMSQESALLTMRSFIQNFEQVRVDFATQWLSLVKQIEPTNGERVEESVEADLGNEQVEKQLEQFRKIKVKSGESLGLEDEQSGETMKYDDVEMNPDITKYFDKLDVSVRVEASQLASRQLQAQQMQEAMNATMLVRGNPTFKEDKVVNGELKYYLDKAGVPTKILSLLNEEQQSESTELGELQNLVMEGGQSVAPIFGMSEKHKKQHTDKLVELFTAKRNLENQMASLQPPQPTGDPMTDEMAMEQIQMQGEPIMAEIDKLNKIIDLISEHLKGDMQRKEDSDLASIKMTTPPAPMPPQGQPMPPEQLQMGGEQPPQEMPMNPMPPQGQA